METSPRRATGIRSVLFVNVVILCSATAVRGAVQYTVTDLGTLGGPRSYARAINDAGKVVGYSNTGLATYAFVWEGGTMTSLGTPGGNSYAYDINNAGWAVGYAGGAVLWHDGTVLNLGTLYPNQESRAYGINCWGQVVGDSRDFSSERHGFLWDNGTMSYVVGSAGHYGSSARAINDLGQAVGAKRIPYPDYDKASTFWAGKATLLGPYPSGVHGSIALGINNEGRVVGYDGAYTETYDGTQTYDGAYTETMSGRPFVSDSTTGFAYMATLGGTDGYALAVSDAGLIVGSSETTGGDLRATIWSNTPEHTPTDLNTLISSDSGWAYLAQAYDINDSGQIVGYGRLTGSIFDRAFLLTPVPEPATIGLLALGGLVILRKCRCAAGPGRAVKSVNL